jgi:pyruvate dehydrogenase E2 component (dihydrolipoamide acetyltransferase)
MRKEVPLPEISENVQSGVVFSILVEEGEQVEAEQPLLELESEKATVEVPAPFGGTVIEIKVSEGETAEVGQTIMIIETEDAGAGAAGAEKNGSATTEEAEAAGAEEGGAEDAEAAAAKEESSTEKSEAAGAEEPPQPEASAAARVPASPAVRRFARELGVDVREVHGSGPHGRISKEDVQAHVKSAITAVSGTAGAAGTGAAGAQGDAGAPGAPGPAGSAASRPLPDFSRWGEVERESLSSVRRVTAEGTAHSWQVIPHVTHNDKADITELEEFRKSYKTAAEQQSTKLTLTAILVKAAAAGLQRHPKLNASIDPQHQEIIYKRYVHIGVAVDTPRGLLMPVIRDVPQKGILAIARELEELADRAKNGRLGPDEMSGGSFAVSNLGGIGGTSFTPIVYWPQSAILGVSSAETEPVWRDGQWVPRLRLPLSLSYDHRLIDGADGARFLRWVAEALQYPLLMQLEGGENG